MKENALFKIENQILQKALNNLERHDYQDNPLLLHYDALTHSYHKLLRQSVKLLKIGDSQQRNLQKNQQDVRNLLDNAGQGFLTLGYDLTVNNEYGGECLRIFGSRIENQNIVDLLFGDYDDEQKAVISEALHSVWDEPDNEKKEICLQRLPEKVDLHDRNYLLEYRPIKTLRNNEEQDLIMMVITDVTERQKAEKQIEYLSFHDKLTGLYNRAYVDEALVELNNEDNLPISMIIGDVNGLKITNDVFGHLQGDRLLQNISRVLNQCLREDDIIARWGGDEFLVILPQTDENMVEKVCKRIKEYCNKTPPDPIKLSISLGTAIKKNLDESYSDMFSRAEDQMYKNKLQERQQVQEDLLLAMHRLLRGNTCENEQHLERMMKLARLMADTLEFDEALSQELINSVFMHDIGKVAVGIEILNKPGPLNEVEWETVKKHSEVGYRLGQALSKYQLADYILAHHEFWDGTGYPNGIKGEDIPLVARIISLIDAFDIMTHDVPYKNAVSCDAALEELSRCSGTQFDPQLVQIFQSIFRSTDDMTKNIHEN